MALAKRVQSASSHNNAVPACETRLHPSVVTTTRQTERLRRTVKVCLLLGYMTAFGYSHSPS